jgi:hypothetical protein
MERSLTGCFFLAGAGMLWIGWLLLTPRIGMFFRTEDFAGIRPRLRFWLWMYRVHLFGMVISALAVVALAALVVDSPARVLVWPGAAVAVAGLIVGAVGSAFYYHFGVWGTLEVGDKPPDAIRGFIDSLRLATHYITCLVRFGRVFTGLGLTVLALGLLNWQVLPWWIGAGAAAVGVAAMALTMALPDKWELYTPVFHFQALWLAATGAVLLLTGVAPAS